MAWRKDFFPERETDMLSFARNFANRISDDPERYSLTEQQAADYLALTQDFEHKYRIANAPLTRTKGTVAQKNAARKAIERKSRKFARLVGGRRDLTAVDLIELGLKVRPKKLGRASKPALAPQLSVMSVFGNVVTLRLRDASGARRRGRPPEVEWALLFSCVGERPPSTPNGWRARGCTTRTRVRIAFGPEVAPGSKVWLTAVWANRRGHSPAATPVSAHLQQGTMIKTSAVLQLAA